MMVTKEQAHTARRFHFIGWRPCNLTIGPKGGIYLDVTEVRASGKMQEWKRDPQRFVVPVKYGLYESTYLTDHNAANFHVPEDCPAIQELNKYQAAKRAEALGPGIVKGGANEPTVSNDHQAAILPAAGPSDPEPDPGSVSDPGPLS